jgi:hypothetical protein
MKKIQVSSPFQKYSGLPISRQKKRKTARMTRAKINKEKV